MSNIGILSKLLNTEEKKKEAKASSTPVLPYSVRYVLKYRPEEFFKENIKSLTGKTWVDLGFYLSMKAMDDDIDLQSEMMEDVSDNITSGETIGSVVRDYLDEMDDIVVNGTKVAQMSRIGPGEVQQRFQEGADKIYSEGKTPIIIGYSGLIGYRAFLERLPQENKLMVAIAHHLDNPEFTGYLIERKDDQAYVQLIGPDSNPGDLGCAVFVDETVNGGTTLNQIINFWKDKEWSPICEGRCIVNVNNKKYVQDIPVYAL